MTIILITTVDSVNDVRQLPLLQPGHSHMRLLQKVEHRLYR